MAIENDPQRIFDELKAKSGIALKFDDRGLCLLEHEDDFEILIRLQEDIGRLTFTANVCLITATDTSHLHTELLKQNLTGDLAGPFSFALGRAQRNVLLTMRRQLSGLDAKAIEDIIAGIVEACRRSIGPVRRAQLDGVSLADEASDTKSTGSPEHPIPGMFV